MAKKRKSKLGIGVAAAAIVAAVGAGLVDGVKETVKNVATDTIGWARSQIDELSPLPQADTSAALSVFVAQFEGDDSNDSQTTHVVEALRRAFPEPETAHGVQVTALSRALKRRKLGNATGNFQAAEEKGRGWLKESKADVLIWGEVVERNKGLRIYFVLSEGNVRLSQKNYGFADAVTLTQNFDQDLGLVIAARVAELVKSAREVLAPIPKFLEPLYSRLKTIALHQLINQTAAACVMYDSIGVVALVLGESKRDEGDVHLREAMDTYERALSDDRCRGDTDLVALFHNNLGITLVEIGKWVDGKRLEDAETHFRTALLLRPRDRVPLKWASTQSNLGIFLSLLGHFRDNPTKLEESAAIFRLLLEFHSREGRSPDWAFAQLNLGDTLDRLGLSRSDPSMLKEAIAAYQAALEVFSSRRMASRAAVATGNKGRSLRNLAEECADAGLAQNAVETLDAAVRMSRESRMADFAESFDKALTGAREVLEDLKEKRDSSAGSQPTQGC